MAYFDSIHRATRSILARAGHYHVKRSAGRRAFLRGAMPPSKINSAYGGDVSEQCHANARHLKRSDGSAIA